MISICPVCGQTVPLNEPLPDTLECPHCQAILSVKKAGLTAHLTPFSGGDEAEREVEAIANEKDPLKKYEDLKKLEALYPSSEAVQFALLLHGRLHERNPKKLDFSVIKCYLLHPYEVPSAHTVQEKSAYARELFDHPQLKKCIALSKDPDALTRKYLQALCDQYLALFLLGSSKYSSSLWNFISTGKPEKTLAVPVSTMLKAMEQDENLNANERQMLMECLYAAFKTRFSNTSYLDKLI